MLKFKEDVLEKVFLPALCTQVSNIGRGSHHLLSEAVCVSTWLETTVFFLCKEREMQRVSCANAGSPWRPDSSRLQVIRAGVAAG